MFAVVHCCVNVDLLYCRASEWFTVQETDSSIMSSILYISMAISYYFFRLHFFYYSVVGLLI